MFGWGIRSIMFSGGETIELDPGSVLIIVGPNSSGKSAALREIEAGIGSPNQNPVVQTVHQFRNGEKEDLRSWMEQHYPSRPTTNGKVFVTRRAIVHENDVQWSSVVDTGLGNVAEFLKHRLDTATRLQLGDRVGAFNVSSGEAEAYIHILQLQESLLKEMSAEVRKAFGKDLIINRGGGGTLLAAKCGAHPLLLIDEPEAFLHPPQARRLAGILSRSAKELNRQVIIATHSSDVVRGALDESDRVVICRLTRQGDVNHAIQLSSAQIKTLWAKPLLRSAAAIDGVFHEGVVVCEADSDSRFYEALLRRLISQQQVTGLTDLYFIHGGGKGEIATLASVYRQLQVPVAAVADLDLLRQQPEFEKVVSTLGGDFKQLETQYKATVSALNKLPRKSAKDFLNEARLILAEIDQQNTVMPAHRKAFSQLIADAGDWSEAKRYGIDKLRGGARQTAKGLLDACKAFGLFLVPNGELEGWWHDGPSDKGPWFSAAIEELFSNGSSFGDASAFMAGVSDYLGRVSRGKP